MSSHDMVYSTPPIKNFQLSIRIRLSISIYCTKKRYTKKEDKKAEVVLYEDTGDTLHEAFRKISLKSPKKLYAGHVNTVIISENIAKTGLSKVFDFILRDA